MAGMDFLLGASRRKNEDLNLRAQELEQRRKERESIEWARRVDAAFKLLGAGQKDAAGQALEGLGYPVRGPEQERLGPTREADPAGGYREGPPTYAPGGFDQLRTPEEMEIAKETRGFGREAALRGSDSEQAVDRAQRTNPQAALTGFVDRAKSGQLTDEDQSGIDYLLSITRQEEGATQALTRRIVKKLETGVKLAPHELDFAYTHKLTTEKPPNIAAEDAEEKAYTRGRQGAADAQSAAAGARGAAHLGLATEEAGRQREKDAETRRVKPLTELDRVVTAVRKRFAASRDKLIPGMPNSQSEGAALEANESAEIAGHVNRYKQRYPQLAEEIEEQFGGMTTKQIPLMDLFKRAFQK